MRCTALVVLACLACLACLFGCTPRDAVAPSPEVPEEPTPRDRSFDPVSVQFHVVGEVPRKPPLIELQVDIVILNPASEAHWVLLPRQAGKRPLEDGGVDVLEVERWGRVLVGNWLGTGGFRAVRVGPDADVRFARVPVQWWRHDDDPQPSLEALAGRALVVDGKRAEEYFESDPTVPAVSTWISVGAPGEVIATVRHRPDLAEVAVELLEPIEVRYVPWPRD